jgi:hypothetical protein
MFHTVAYHGTVTPGTQIELTPVPDSTLTINGNDIQVPSTYNKLVRAGASPGDTGSKYFEFESPSLRGLYFPQLPKFAAGPGFPNERDFEDFEGSPLQLVTNEGLSVYSDIGPTGGGDAYVVTFLSDSPLAKASGNFRTIRATASIQAAVDAWVSGAITFDQTLPVGQYDIVGMRVEGTGLVAARLIFIGLPSGIRPGVLCQDAAGQKGQYQFRHGYAGVFGSFPETNPPSLEVLGGTASAQVLYLDLIKRS